MKIDDLLAANQQQYPLTRAGAAPSSQQSDSIINRLFAPQELGYPLPMPTTQQQQTSASVAPASVAQAATAQPAATAAVAAQPAAPAQPLSGQLVPLARVTKVLRSYSFNPEFKADSYGSTSTDPVQIVSKDATPIAFVVPDGCDSFDLLLGPVEVNPSVGVDGDLEQLILTGQAKLSASDKLAPGDQLTVTIPWRAETNTDLAANRLRMKVICRFYRKD
jgi:hypothetical protein